MTKLREQDIMCAEILTDAGQSIRGTAQQMGVAESTLRYRLRRRRQQAIDGRSQQTEKCALFDDLIQSWIATQAESDGRPDSVQSLYEQLTSQHGFTGSYKAVWRYVRRRRTPPKIRPKRRVETQPGTILCILRDRARTDVFRLWSQDAGRTWSPRENIREMLDGVLQRPFLTRLHERILLLTGRDYERRLMVAYLSRDNGETFGDRTVLDSYQEDGAYTTVIPTGPMRGLIAWYSDSHTVPLRPDVKLATVKVGDAKMQ